MAEIEIFGLHIPLHLGENCTQLLNGPIAEIKPINLIVGSEMIQIYGAKAEFLLPINTPFQLRLQVHLSGRISESAVSVLASGATHQRLDPNAHLLDVNWLGDEVIGPMFQTLSDFQLFTEGDQKDDEGLV
jgi:hypothetical protein